MASNHILLGHSNNLPCLWLFFKLGSTDVIFHHSISTRIIIALIYSRSSSGRHKTTSLYPILWPDDQCGWITESSMPLMTHGPLQLGTQLIAVRQSLNNRVLPNLNLKEIMISLFFHSELYQVIEITDIRITTSHYLNIYIFTFICYE